MEDPKATEANAPTIAPEETVKVNTVTEDDLEAKNLALEAEKSRLIEEAANYKLAYLKEKRKKEQLFTARREEKGEIDKGEGKKGKM